MLISGLKSESCQTRLEWLETHFIVALPFWKNEHRSTLPEEIQNFSKGSSVARIIGGRSVRLLGFIVYPAKWHDSENSEHQGNQRIPNECSLGSHCNSARHDPRYDQRIDKRILMIHRDEKRSTGRNLVPTRDADVAIEPVKRNSIDPPQPIVDHGDRTVWVKLSGTPRNIQSASVIPIATVITPAR